MEGAEQVSHNIDRHTIEEAAIHHFLWRNHSRHLSGAATQAHNDRRALLVGLQVSQHNPEGDVGHVRTETVVLVVLGGPTGRDTIVEVVPIGRQSGHHVGQDDRDRNPEALVDVRLAG